MGVVKYVRWGGQLAGMVRGELVVGSWFEGVGEA